MNYFTSWFGGNTNKFDNGHKDAIIREIMRPYCDDESLFQVNDHTIIQKMWDNTKQSTDPDNKLPLSKAMKRTILMLIIMKLENALGDEYDEIKGSLSNISNEKLGSKSDLREKAILIMKFLSFQTILANKPKGFRSLNLNNYSSTYSKAEFKLRMLMIDYMKQSIYEHHVSDTRDDSTKEEISIKIINMMLNELLELENLDDRSMYNILCLDKSLNRVDTYQNVSNNINLEDSRQFSENYSSVFIGVYIFVANETLGMFYENMHMCHEKSNIPLIPASFIERITEYKSKVSEIPMLWIQYITKVNTKFLVYKEDKKGVVRAFVATFIKENASYMKNSNSFGNIIDLIMQWTFKQISSINDEDTTLSAQEMITFILRTILNSWYVLSTYSLKAAVSNQIIPYLKYISEQKDDSIPTLTSYPEDRKFDTSNLFENGKDILQNINLYINDNSSQIDVIISEIQYSRLDKVDYTSKGKKMLVFLDLYGNAMDSWSCVIVKQTDSTTSISALQLGYSTIDAYKFVTTRQYAFLTNIQTKFTNNDTSYSSIVDICQQMTKTLLEQDYRDYTPIILIWTIQFLYGGYDLYQVKTVASVFGKPLLNYILDSYTHYKMVAKQ